MTNTTSELINEPQALISAGGAVLLWSTVATAFKLGLTQLTPAQLLFSACIVSTLVFTAALAWSRIFSKPLSKKGANNEPRVTRHTITEALVLGLLNPGLYYLILFEAYDRLPAQLAQPLNYTWAITLALLAIPVLGQKLSGRALLGIIVSYSGVLILLVGGQQLGGLTWDITGVGLALLSTLIWAGYWLANTKTKTPGTLLLCLSFAFATPLVGIYCWLVDGWPPLTSHTLIYGLWVGMVEMGLAFLLWQRALRLTAHAGRISQLIFLSPFLSLVLISQVLGETIATSSIAGLAVIVVGLVLAGQPAAQR